MGARNWTLEDPSSLELIGLDLAHREALILPLVRIMLSTLYRYDALQSSREHSSTRPWPIDHAGHLEKYL